MKSANNTALDIAASEECETYRRYESYRTATNKKMRLRQRYHRETRVFLCQRCQGYHLRDRTEQEVAEVIDMRNRFKAIQHEKREAHESTECP